MGVRAYLDQALAQDVQAHIVQLDITKCFNNLDYDTALFVMTRWGMPLAYAETLRQGFQYLLTRYRRDSTKRDLRKHAGNGGIWTIARWQHPVIRKPSSVLTPS